MKNLLLAILTLSSSVFASEPRNDPFKDQKLSCIVTSDNKRYHDIFVIEVREKGYSHVKYKRIHLASPKDADGNLLHGDLELVRGCYHGIQVRFEHNPTYMNIECINDGEDGSVTIYPPFDGPTIEGEIYFYKPQIGYPERTLLELSCQKSELNSP